MPAYLPLLNVGTRGRNSIGVVFPRVPCLGDVPCTIRSGYVASRVSIRARSAERPPVWPHAGVAVPDRVVFHARSHTRARRQPAARGLGRPAGWPSAVTSRHPSAACSTLRSLLGAEGGGWRCWHPSLRNVVCAAPGGPHRAPCRGVFGGSLPPEQEVGTRPSVWRDQAQSHASHF